MVRSLLARRRLVLGLLTGVTILLAALIPSLRFSTSVYDLIVEDIPESAHYSEFKDIFGSEEIIRIVVRCADALEAANFAKIAELAEAAAMVPGIRRVISLPGIKHLVDPTGSWPLERFKAHVGEVELLQRNLISGDRTVSAITLVLDDVERHAEVITAINALINQSGPDLSLYQIGMPLISEALAEFARRDFLTLPPITFVLITLMLLIIYRGLSYLLIVISCIGMALIWNLGFISLSGRSLSMLTMIVPVFLIAVGTAYCLHIVNTHRLKLLQTGVAEAAVIDTMAECSLPTVLAIGTTAIGLASLFVNRIDAVSEFALFACLGILSFMIILLTGLPLALSFIRPSARGGCRLRPPEWTQRLLEIVIRINLDHHKKAYLVLGAIALIALSGLPRLRVETNPVDYFRPDTEVIRNFHDIYGQLSGSFPVNIDLRAQQAGYFEALAHLELVDQLVGYAETLPGVDKAVGFTSYLKLVNYAVNGFAPEYYRLPQDSLELRLLINSYRSMLGWDMLSAFVESDFGRTSVLLLTHLSSSQAFLELRRRIAEFAAAKLPNDLSAEVTGFGMVVSASSHYLVTGQTKSLCLSLVLIFAIMFGLFLSLKVGVVAMVPNIFPIIVNFGLMGWLGIELSVGTALIASIAIGLAVDDTIHYMVCFNREFKKDLDERRAMRDTLLRIGQPIIFTTMTVSIGFAVLAFSSFKPTSTFGTLMVVTMISALIGDLIILPSLLRHVNLLSLWDLVRIKMGGDPSVKIPLLRGMSRAEVQAILMAGTIRNIAAGDVLFRKGEASDSMYAVISGRFEIIDYAGESSTAGSRMRINVNGAGDILGEMGPLRKAPRSATVIARDSGELLLINWKVLRHLQWLYPPIANKLFHNLLNILCGRVERLTHCLINESTVDDLPCLCNRNGFCRILEREVRRADRRGERLLLYLLRVNPDAPPEYAERRNQIVSALAAKLSERIRGDDALARLDGATLALLACSNAEMPQIRRRLEETIGQIKEGLPAGDCPIMLTSVDVALETELGGDEILFRCLHVLAPMLDEAEQSRPATTRVLRRSSRRPVTGYVRERG